MVTNGAVAPSNSMLAASLETLSYKNNALKQQQDAPCADELMAKLMQLIPQSQDQQGASVQYQSALDFAETVSVAEAAYRLECLKQRAALERQFQAQTQALRQALFSKCRALDEKFVVGLLGEFGPMSAEEEKFAAHIVDIVPEYLAPSLEALNGALLSGSGEKVLPVHLPGFRLSLKFEDGSVLECAFRADLEDRLADAQATAITGTAAQLLAFVVQRRTEGVFSALIPLTEGEARLRAASGRGEVSAAQEGSFALARRLAARLTMCL